MTYDLIFDILSGFSDTLFSPCDQIPGVLVRNWKLSEIWDELSIVPGIDSIFFYQIINIRSLLCCHFCDVCYMSLVDF
jgi:hypothetical protein